MNDFITEEMKLAVKRGAHWLDNNHFRWAELIRLEELEMDDCASCIVGQAIGDYSVALANGSGEKIYSQETYDWAVDHGFDLPQEIFNRGDRDPTGHREYRKLETLWTEEVKNRLG